MQRNEETAHCAIVIDGLLYLRELSLEEESYSLPEVLNILFLSSWYPSRVQPLLGNFIQRHAEAVASRHKVHVLYMTADPLLRVPTELVTSEEGNLKVSIIYFRKTGIPLLGRLRAMRAAMVHLGKEGNQRPDIIHHHVIFPEGWQALLLSRKLGVPVVVTEHWTLYNRVQPGHLPLSHQILLRALAKRTTVLCPVTGQLGKSIQAHGWRGQERVIPNVVDTSLFQVGIKPSDRVQFLHVSSLDDNQKNITGILRVWKKISERNIPVHLNIGGDGPWKLYQEKAIQMGIPAQSIHFFGEQTWSGIAELMRHSHILLLFSNYENLPCVIVEALASGMRIISTDVGGIREHISVSRGTLIKAGDEDALESAIISESETAHVADREQLRLYAETHFSIPSVSKAFSEVYRNAREAGTKHSAS